MRFDGKIKSWDDERGFGFIEPDQGGRGIFVHIKAFKDLRERPQANQRVSFEVEMGPKGKKRAFNAEFIRATKPARTRPPQNNQPAQWGTATLFALPAFGVVLVLGYVQGQPPGWLLWAYLGMSIITYITYARDKSAAENGEWRVSEQTLHFLALACGWPGALLAQQILRHKSSKQAFRSMFWFTVGLNVLGFLFMASPFARQFIDF